MTLLKCATLVVESVTDACARYVGWMGYRVVEQGQVPRDLAEAWHCPASAGCHYVVLQPESGADVFLRFVEGSTVPGYLPIRTYGWAATELCVTDVEVVHARMQQGPFEVIGPPRMLDGFTTIKPMQVQGPDAEVVYLTEFAGHDPALALPRPVSLVDRPFIIVHACRDLDQGLRWLRDVLGLAVTVPVSLRYTMIERAFGLSSESRTAIATAGWPDGETFLEFDQYPAEATERPGHAGALPPGVAVVTMLHPDMARLGGHWLSPPCLREGAIYGGRRSGVLLTPDGALLEVVDVA